MAEKPLAASGGGNTQLLGREIPDYFLTKQMKLPKRVSESAWSSRQSWTEMVLVCQHLTLLPEPLINPLTVFALQGMWAETVQED